MAFIKPRSIYGERPTCETVMPAAYFKRQYRVRDALDPNCRYGYGDVYPVGHLDGGYCLDRIDPATGSHVGGDFVHHPETQ